MTFFDKKTEVMKVELTPYGRYKLSIGKLKPHHYRFFDNNVAYHGKALGITEDQNDADHRIRQETPVLKQNPNITGVETAANLIETDEITVQMDYVSYGGTNLEPVYYIEGEDKSTYRSNERKNKRDDHINQLVYNLGTIEHDKEYSPSFQVDAFRGKLSGSTSKFYSSPNIQTSSIPQIDLEIEYEAIVTNSFLDVVAQNFQFQSIGPFQDGSTIILKFQDPLLRIKETNAFDEKENFHITAYRVFKQDNVGKLVYEKMKFDKESRRIVSDLYVGDDGQESPTVYSPNDVSYYFEILTDKDIAESDYCETIGDLEIRNIYLDNEIICPDQQPVADVNIYQSQVNPEDLEDCD